MKIFGWGERGNEGKPGQRPPTACTHTHPPDTHEHDPTAGRHGAEAQENRAKGRPAARRQKAPGAEPRARPGHGGSQDHPRAERGEERTHPPGTPEGGRKEPAVRAARPGREARPTGAHVRPRGGVGAGGRSGGRSEGYERGRRTGERPTTGTQSLWVSRTLVNMDPSRSDERITRRLRDALVADLVLGELDESGEYWLTAKLEPRDWTHHLARQLGVDMEGPGGIHDTLLLIVREVDRLIGTLRPTDQLEEICKELAHEATKNLQPLDVYATLLAGPARWRQKKIEAGCRIANLPGQLQPILERELATELRRVLGEWAKLDFRKLGEQREEAVKAARANADVGAKTTASTGPRQPQTAQDRGDRLKLRPFQPRGRT